AATMTGPVQQADSRAVLRVLLTMPLETLMVAARIRWQGMGLWARGLRMIPRGRAQGAGVAT
ncbi:MAG: DUF1365 family protein, partial [Mycobacterium sp.]